MKNYTFIIYILFSVQLGAFSLKASSQERHTENCGNVRIIHRQSTGPTNTINSHNPDTILIADETILIHYVNSSKIICDNETIFSKIHRTHSQLFKYKFEFRNVGKWYYKHYELFLSRHDADIIVKWSKTNL